MDDEIGITEVRMELLGKKLNEKNLVMKQI
jgi:hypothetical protein